MIDPRCPIPSKKTNPNHKVDDFFKHFNEASLDACDPGMNLVTCKQDQKFAGGGESTIRCKLKCEGDGYFIVSICERGRTLSFYPRNQPPPNDWRRKGYSPMRSRILFMRNQLEPNSYHRLLIDNLFSSAKFSDGAKNETRSKVLACGAARKSGRGVSSLVHQEEEGDINQKKLAVGTLKGAILKGEDNNKNMAPLLVHDAKPDCFLFNCMQEIK